MLLKDALELAEDEYCASPDSEELMTAELEVIHGSSPFRLILRTNLETIPTVGFLGAFECAVTMAIRFGMRTQRILDRSAPDKTDQPLN
jgi:hypothetical protein